MLEVPVNITDVEEDLLCDTSEASLETCELCSVFSSLFPCFNAVVDIKEVLRVTPKCSTSSAYHPGAACETASDIRPSGSPFIIAHTTKYKLYL